MMGSNTLPSTGSSSFQSCRMEPEKLVDIIVQHNRKGKCLKIENKVYIMSLWASDVSVSPNV